MSAVMGVDPGVRGGVAVLAARDRRVLFVRGFQPSMTEEDCCILLHHAIVALHEGDGNACFVERVGYIPGDGGQGAFTFGKVFGFVRGFLYARSVVVRDVMPAMWQTRLECLTGGDKNVSKRKAQHLFPGVKVTHAIADSLLIAEFGRRALFLPIVPNIQP